MRSVWFLVSIALLASGCATTYQPRGATGGYAELRLAEDVWRVTFNGNGHTNRETVQTYWLYRAASLTLERGFDGFEMLSNVPFVRYGLPEPVEVAAAAPVFIPMYMPSAPVLMPLFEADIRLINEPVDHSPPKRFDAERLKAELEQYVNGEKCEKGNVCPHIHAYVLPVGALEPRQRAREAAGAPVAPSPATAETGNRAGTRNDAETKR